MAVLGPFETAPRLAVAVSGGPDSLALALLAADWAGARGGEVLALSVDHGLRPESAAEACQVGEWLSARGIAHSILRWTGPKPATGIQAAARAARYALLEDRCRREGILHLLLGHQREDQAETIALRKERKSGPDGLAGMAALAERPGVRLLRPLIEVPKVRLRATLEALGQPWIEDPSNRDRRFARVRLRERGSPDDDGRAAARSRRLLEGETARLLAAACSFREEGCILVDGPLLAAAPPDLGRRALVRILLAVGGGDYPPRGDRLDRLWARLVAGRGSVGATLGGCRLRPWRGRLRVEPEARLDYSRRGEGKAPLSPVGFFIADRRERTIS
jgi:tRNA(Ile)-lysidine synthase